jgi:hypothetical protein
MVALYGVVSKETYDIIKILYDEYVADTMCRGEVEHQLMEAVKRDPSFKGTPEYFANYITGVVRDVAYTPYGVACSDGIIRMPYKFIGIVMAEEEAGRTGPSHEGCPGGQHYVLNWPECAIDPTVPVATNNVTS